MKRGLVLLALYAGGAAAVVQIPLKVRKSGVGRGGEGGIREGAREGGLRVREGIHMILERGGGHNAGIGRRWLRVYGSEIRGACIYACMGENSGEEEV